MSKLSNVDWTLTSNVKSTLPLTFYQLWINGHMLSGKGPPSSSQVTVGSRGEAAAGSLGTKVRVLWKGVPYGERAEREPITGVWAHWGRSPPPGSRGRAPGHRVRGRSPPEAVSLLAFWRPAEAADLPSLFCVLCFGGTHTKQSTQNKAQKECLPVRHKLEIKQRLKQH